MSKPLAHRIVRIIEMMEAAVAFPQEGPANTKGPGKKASGQLASYAPEVINTFPPEDLRSPEDQIIDDGIERVLDQQGGAPCAVADARMGVAGLGGFRVRKIAKRPAVQVASVTGLHPERIAIVMKAELARSGAFELVDRDYIGAATAEIQAHIVPGGDGPTLASRRPDYLANAEYTLVVRVRPDELGRGKDAKRGELSVEFTLALVDATTEEIAGMGVGRVTPAGWAERGRVKAFMDPHIRTAIDRAIEHALDQLSREAPRSGTPEVPCSGK